MSDLPLYAIIENRGTTPPSAIANSHPEGIDRLNYAHSMSVRINLDLDILRTLSVAQELGSLAQAAEQLGRTPSAISLQMKRLQDDLGIVLFRKHGRNLALTEAGVVVLDYARRILALHDELLDTMQGASIAGHIRLGCTQDFASILPSVLSQFSLLYPRTQIELRIEGNSALADAVEASQIDLAVVIGHEGRAAAQTVGHLDLVWIAASSFARPQDQPLPLAALGPQCIFRRRVIEQLDAKKIPHRIAANSPGLDGLWASLLGGLGVTARTALNLPDGLIASGSLYGLPELGQLPVTLQRSTHSDSKAIDRMADLVSQSLKLALESHPNGKARAHKHNGVIDISTSQAGKPKLRSTMR
jgi:DNA-binding transcriptional LysR family regulator